MYNVKDLDNKERAAIVGQMWFSVEGLTLRWDTLLSPFSFLTLTAILSSLFRIRVYSVPFYEFGVSMWMLYIPHTLMSLNYFITLWADPKKWKVMCLWLKENCSRGSAIWQEVLGNSVFKIRITSLFTILEVTISLLCCYYSVL